MLKKNLSKIKGLKASFGMIKLDTSYCFEQVEEYFKKSKVDPNGYFEISDRTCNDLDLNDFFQFADRTTSRVGQQYLYSLIRRIPLNGSAFLANEQLIEEFISNETFRIQVQLELSKLDKKEAYYIPSILLDEHPKRPRWIFLVKYLSIANIMSVLMLVYSAKFIVPVIVISVVNLIIHYWNKRNLFQYFDVIPQLLRLIEVAKKLGKNDSLFALEPNLERSINSLATIKRNVRLLNFNPSMQGDIAEILLMFVELIRSIFLLEVIGLFGAISQFERKRGDIETLFRFVGRVDALISVASLRCGVEHCQPIILSKGDQVEATDMFHPLIDGCVSNSLTIEKKSVLLTGSNMSGKTSFIRTLGINVISALTLNTAFAKNFATPRLCVQSAIRISDDLLNDRSYYFAEVLAIKQMVENSSSPAPNLYLLDEIFKGTNTVERIAAGKAVLSYLAKNDNIVMVSTHDVELADLLKDEYDLYHFCEFVNNQTVDFDYKLKRGKLTTRNAIKILQINGYPSSIIDEANKIVGLYD